MKKKPFLFILIFLTIFLVACKAPSDEECSVYNDEYLTYGYDSSKGECVVIKSLQKNFCGNGKAEEANNENSCNCPQDVPESHPTLGCSGNEGDYLTYTCSAFDECELEVNENVRLNSKLLSLKQGTDFTIDTTVNYFVPFMIDRHNVEVDFFLKEISTSSVFEIKDLKLIKATLVTSTKEVLGSTDIDEELKSQFDEHSIEIPVDAFTFDTFEKDMKNVFIKVLVTYTKNQYSNGQLIKTSNETKELQGTFENTFTLIDPDNKEKEKGTSAASGWG